MRESRRRWAHYLARFLTWRHGRAVKPPCCDTLEPHWWELPMRFADTGEPVVTHAT